MENGQAMREARTKFRAARMWSEHSHTATKFLKIVDRHNINL